MILINIVLEINPLLILVNVLLLKMVILIKEQIIDLLLVWSIRKFFVTLQSVTSIVMDPVLRALEHYRTTASPTQKAADLCQLEKECLSAVDAYLYVSEITMQSPGFSVKQDLNYNLNPDYDLDFSLSLRPYANLSCICIQKLHIYKCGNQYGRLL